MNPQTQATRAGQASELFLDAIREQNTDKVLELLQNGIDVETKDENGNRALSIAAGLGSSPLVRMLVRFDAKTHVEGEKREAPLIAAALHNNLDVVKLFKSWGMNEWERRQALLDAIRNGHLQIVEVLLIVPKDMNWEQSNGSGINYLSVASSHNQYEIAAFLLSKGATQLSLKKRWTSPLHMAAAEGYMSIVILLVDHRADLLALNSRGFTPLLVACFNNQGEVAGYLASKMDRLDLDIRTDSHIAAIHYAILKGNSQLAHKLLDCGADPDGHPGDITMPLHMAITMNLSAIAVDLLDHEADSNSRDKRGFTALHLAATSSNCLTLVQRFLDNGVDVNDRSTEDITPLYRAVEYNNTAAVELLLKNQANPNEATKLGLSPLHEAAARGNDQMVELLLKGGADIEAVAFDKTEPIHLAAANWKSSVVQKLLTYHQTFSDIDGYGMTIWQYASDHAPTLATQSPKQTSENSADLSIIDELRSKTLFEMVSLYRELCMKIKNPETEKKLVTGITSILLLKRDTSLFHQFYQTWEPLWETRFGYEIRFTCFNCHSMASFRELHRCMQCFPICICTQCYSLHLTNRGINQCAGHKIIHLMGKRPAQPPGIADLDALTKEILRRFNPHIEVNASSESNLPVRSAMIGKNIQEATPVAPISNVISATCITPTTPTTPGETVTFNINTESTAHSIPSSVDGVQVEEVQDISAALDEWLQEYATNRDDEAILVKTIKIIKDDLPFTSLGFLKYTRFYSRLSLILWTYKSLGAAAHSVDNLENVLALTEEVLSLSSTASPTWITYCIALVWLCNRRLTMDKNTVIAVERYITIIEKLMPIAASNSLLKHNSAIQVIIQRLLGNLHSLQYDRNSMMKHLNNAIIFQRSAIFQDVKIAQEDRDTYYDLGMLLCSRYERTRMKVDIIECIEMLRIYCNLIPKSALDRVVGLNRAIGLNNLAYAIELRFQTGIGQTKDLDEALKSVQEALEIMEKSYPKIITLRGEILTNLGNILFRRYEALGAIEDLETAIDASRKSLDQPDISDDTRAARWNSLAYRLRMKYDRMKHFGSIEEGISIVMQAFSIRTPERQTTCLLLNTMVGLLVEKCRRDTGSKVDWDRAVRFAKIAVGSEPSLSSRIPYMQNLSAVLTERYEKFHDEKDLAEAIDYGLRCLRSTKVSHPLRSTLLTGVGSRFSLRYNRTNSFADLDCALGLHEAAVQLNPSNEIAVNNFGVATMGRWFATKDEIYLQLAIDRMESLYQSPKFSNFGRVRAATAAGVLSMELEDYTRASLSLKGAVSLLPELYLPLIDRKDLQHVLSQLSELPERVASALLLNDHQSVVDALNLMESSRGIISSLMMKAKRDNSMVTQTLLHTDSNIPVDAKSYMKLAEYGSIVSFVVSNRKSSAIIITAQGIKCIDLESLRYNHLRSEAMEYLVGKDTVTEGSNSTRLMRNRRLQTLLKWLWNVAVKPILKNLDLITNHDPQAKLPRIWWISSGLMGVMPLHAAGDHTHGSTENTISHVVSSYAPTLKSLSYSRQRLDHLEKERNPSVTIVAMAQTESRKPLNVEPEITAINAAFPQTTILRTPTPKMTLENMQTCNIGHFICHGYSDPQDPSKSGLVLSSGSLTLENLSQHFFLNAHIAYLSACSTAKTSTRKLVDEVQHLGSGFQLAGFPHAIATLWQVDDRFAAKVASDFYDGIKGINGSYLEEGVVARALHNAVKIQRDKSLDDPIAWAAQVHFGP